MLIVALRALHVCEYENAHVSPLESNDGLRALLLDYDGRTTGKGDS